VHAIHVLGTFSFDIGYIGSYKTGQKSKQENYNEIKSSGQDARHDYFTGVGQFKKN
jgi:hypothetical protein